MSSSTGQSNGWTKVKKSGRSHRGHNKKSRRKRKQQGQSAVIPIVHSVSNRNISFDKLKRNTLREIDDMADSIFFHRFIESFTSTVISNLSSISSADSIAFKVDIICYGLGSFSKSVSSMHQIAFLCAMIRYLSSNNIKNTKNQVDDHSFTLNKAEIFEPILTENEIKILESLGLNVLSIDSEGHYPINTDSNIVTFCFMPHCPRMLYNNLLSTNWPHRHFFDHLYIFGNSFNEYQSLSIGSDPDDPLYRQSEFIRKVHSLGVLHEIDTAEWIQSEKSTLDSLQRERVCIASNAFAFQKLMYFTPIQCRRLKITVTLYLKPDHSHIPRVCAFRKKLHYKSQRKDDGICYKEHRYFMDEYRIDVFDAESNEYWDSITFIPCDVTEIWPRHRHDDPYRYDRKRDLMIPIFVKMRGTTSSIHQCIDDIDTVALHYVAQHVLEHRLQVNGAAREIIEGVIQCGIQWNVRSPINDESLRDYRSPVEHSTMRKLFWNRFPQRLVDLIVEYMGCNKWSTVTVDGEVTIQGMDSMDNDIDWEKFARIHEYRIICMQCVEGMNVEESYLEMDHMDVHGQRVKHIMNVPMSLEHENVPCSLERHSPFKSSSRNRWKSVRVESDLLWFTSTE